MFNKPLTKIDLADIRSLVEQRKEPEGQHLEYKRELSQKDNKELVKDVTAFANASGGYLLIGVDESTETVCGAPEKIGNQKIDEWISNVLTPNVDPKLRYEMQVITHSTGKAVVVLHIPESPRKPHMLTLESRNSYFVRHNVIISSASHNEVREMFEVSKRSRDVVREFLQQRNLVDPKASNFAQNENTERLSQRVPEDFKTPILMHSFIPLYLQDELIKTASSDFDVWLQQHESGHEPLPNDRLYEHYNKQVHIDGLVLPKLLPKHNVNDEDVYYYYLEILNNGYLESVGSSEFLWDIGRDFLGDGRPHTPRPTMRFVRSVIYTEMLLNFALSFYEKVGYLDEVMLQISIANIRNYALGGFIGGWSEPWSFDYERPPLCSRADNLKLVERFVVSEMDEDAKKTIVRSIAEKISHAFGETKVKCYDKDGNFDLSHMRGFRHY